MKRSALNASLGVILFCLFSAFSFYGFRAGAAERLPAPSIGQNQVLVILITFNDATPTYSKPEFTELFFGDTSNTFRNYYEEASYGAFTVTGSVEGWFTASGSHDYYGGGNYGQGGFPSYPGNAQRLVEEAVDLAEASGVDFSVYDNSGDGRVDSLIIVHQGQGGERISDSSNIWSFYGAISDGGGTPRYYDGVLIDYFAIVPEVSYKGGRIVECGPPVHEYGHCLGLIDLYDKDSSSSGVGVYDVMSAGVWGPDFDSPEFPVHFSAYSKARLGWIDPIVITGSTQGWFSLPPFELYPFALKIPANPDYGLEYFLAANVQPIGYDRNVLDQGLIIFHVDERAIMENRQERIGCGTAIPTLAVEQADGEYDLEHGENWGDTHDLYPLPGGTLGQFHAASTPNSINHDCRLSGVSITSIGLSGDTIEAYLSADDFRPASDLPLLSMRVGSWDEVSGDGDDYLEAGEVFNLTATLSNNGATAHDVSAVFSSLGSYLVFGDTSSAFPDLGPGQEVSSGDTVLVSILPGYRKGESQRIYATITHDEGLISQNLYPKLGKPDLLYVDDDDGDQTEKIIATYLGNAEFYFDTWEVYKLGPPGSTVMAGYDKVIWATGGDDLEPLSAQEMGVISDYLDAGGNLALSSPYLLLDPEPGVTAFARDYLHVTDFTDDHFAMDKTRGISNDPVSHDSSLFNYSSTIFHYPLLNRTQGLTPDALAAGCILNDRGNYTAVRYPGDGSGPYKTLFASFGLEIVVYYNQSILLRRILNSFNYREGKPFAVIVDPTSARPKATDLVIGIFGMNFNADTGVTFPDGTINVTDVDLVSANRLDVTVNVDIDAWTGMHDMTLSDAAGDTIRLEKMFKVSGTPLPNQVPVASAGADQDGYRTDPFDLDGSLSHDPDYDPVAYKWEILEGGSALILPSDTAQVATLTPAWDFAGDYVILLTVSDPYDSAGDTVRISVYNRAPMADAGPSQIVATGALAELDGSGSYDLDGDSLEYEWFQLDGPAASLDLSDPSRPTFPGDSTGNYLFALQVFDGFEVSPFWDYTEVMVKSPGNNVPAADAGDDQTVSYWESYDVQLDGSGSHDPDQDPLTYRWTMVSRPYGSAAELSDPGSEYPTFDDDQPGWYTISLKVNDGEVWSPVDYVKVYSSNAAMDNDGDGIPDHLDPDDDNDLMPDDWEMAHALDRFDPSDGDPFEINSATDPDGDGNGNVHEYFNQSDPRDGDAHLCPNNLGGCFFGDGNGDFLFDPLDLSLLTQTVAGKSPNLSSVYPGNGDNFDLTGDALVDPLDIGVLRGLLSLKSSSMPGAPADVAVLSPGYSVGANEGELVALEALAMDNAMASDGFSTARPGTALIFEIVSGDGVLLGGEGTVGPRRALAALNVNSNYHDSSFALSRDEKTLIIASNRPGGAGSFDLYISVRDESGDAWGTPLAIATVNTEAIEATPALSLDKLDLYFARENQGTGWDLYKSSRPDESSDFGAPAPVTELNTDGYEAAPTITDDGLVMYFASDGGTGDRDLYRASRPDVYSAFGTPSQVAELNGEYDENAPSISGGDTMILFFSTRPGEKGGTNIWMATRSGSLDPFSEPEELSLINTDLGEYKAWRSVDGLRLYLSTYGYEAGPGIDLFQITRPSIGLPFWVNDDEGRYDVTGVIEGGSTEDSGGRGWMRVHLTGCGETLIAVYKDGEPNRYLETAGAPGLVKINSACP